MLFDSLGVLLLIRALKCYSTAFAYISHNITLTAYAVRVIIKESSIDQTERLQHFIDQLLAAADKDQAAKHWN